MQVRNMLVAAGAVLAGVTAIAAVPATADAQAYRSYRPAYVQTYNNYRPAYAYGYGHDRYAEQRRAAERRREFWEHHRAHEAYRGW